RVVSAARVTRTFILSLAGNFRVTCNSALRVILRVCDFLLRGIAISGEKWMMELGGGVVMDEEVRLREPNRKQLILQQVDYEALLDAEHPARAIWRVLEGLDLSRFCAPIKARENRPGRDATDPRML